LLLLTDTPISSAQVKAANLLKTADVVVYDDLGAQVKHPGSQSLIHATVAMI
jgi:hypothetical protein